MGARTGETLLDARGFLTIDTSGGDTNLHGRRGFFDNGVAIARRWDITHEILDGEEIRRRHPALLAPSDARGYSEPPGGLVFPERCIEVQLRLARSAGAAIRAGETVRAVADGDPVVVNTGRDVYRAAKVVIAVCG